eukprot:TRINITY_DN3909_c0_g1_i1.p1 TRINITY_DN3909_c0_g1~~TRINITY_DN3909_c0_g1_i1.p1  ORF type:complete len:205 (-),score=35.22 TRINITY_DN3909_c0_g1_i1:97-711(-)
MASRYKVGLVKGEPLDYSFLELENFHEIIEEIPRGGIRKPKPDEPAAAQVVGTDGKVITKKVSKVQTVALKLANNQFTSLTGIYSAVEAVMNDPVENLAWADLSFNKISSLGEEIAQFSHLTTVYLHANEISNIQELEVLRTLKLRSLTLHGNPIESTPNYRMRIVAMFPNLKTLDFSPITLATRQTAEVWTKNEKTRRTKKKL